MRYDPLTCRLEVDFVSNSRYAYEGVPSNVWEEFKAAPSKGRFVHSVLRNYKYDRIR